MTEITLIRHGQANSGATDEEGYDRLTPQGHRQAEWLGAYLAHLPPYDRIISGAMRRQQETARGLNRMGLPHEIDPRLNELDYFALSHSLRDSHGVPFPSSQQSFAAQLPQVLSVWNDGGMGEGIESYADFRARILGAVRDAAGGGDRALLVSSTGVIATLTAIALGLDIETKARMFLAVAHTSIHRFTLQGDTLHLSQFGATPHLDLPDRVHARTFI